MGWVKRGNATGPAGEILAATLQRLAPGAESKVVLEGTRTHRIFRFLLADAEPGPRGFPGINVVPTEELLQELADAPDSLLTAALERHYTRKGELRFNIRDHGVKADGVADDTELIQELIDEVPEGTSLWAPPGSVIRTNGWTSSGRDVRLSFESASVVQTANAPILDASGSWSTPVTVGSVSGATVTVALPSEFKVGDLIKVYSDDRIPDARPGVGLGNYARVGQFTVVTSITGNALTVSPRLQDSYVTNVKAVKLLEHQVDVNIGRAWNEGDGTGTLFRMQSLAFPSFKVNVPRGDGAVLGLRSSFGAQTDITATNLPAATGYGLSSSGSVMGSHRIHAARVRHAYTDDVAGWVPDAGVADPGQYGRAMFDTIRGTSINTAESSWDTHHGGVGHKFVGVVGNGAGSNAIFSIRGRGHEWITCTAIDGSVGFRLFDEEAQAWATSTGHMMTSPRAINCFSPVVAALKSWTAVNDGPNLIVNGGDFESRGGELFTVVNARVQFNSDPVFRYNGSTVPGSGFLAQLSAGDLSGRVRIEAEKVSSGSLTAVLYCATNSSGFTQNLDMEMSLRINDHLSTRIGETIWANSVRGRAVVKYHAHNNIPTVAHNTLSATHFSVRRETFASSQPGASSAASNVEVTANHLLQMRSIGDPVVTMFCTASAVRQFSGFGSGAFYGQKLIVHNARTSAALIRVATTTTNVGISSNLELQPGQAGEFVWNGTVWEKV